LTSPRRSAPLLPSHVWSSHPAISCPPGPPTLLLTPHARPTPLLLLHPCGTTPAVLSHPATYPLLSVRLPAPPPLLMRPCLACPAHQAELVVPAPGAAPPASGRTATPSWSARLKRRWQNWRAVTQVRQPACRQVDSDRPGQSSNKCRCLMVVLSQSSPHRYRCRLGGCRRHVY
jgi:hypothetical protein